MRLTTLVLVAMGVAVPFAVANAQQAPQGYEQGPPQGYEQGPPPGYQQGYDQQQGYDRHAMRRLLSRDQRAMLKEELRSEGGGGQVKQAFHERLQELASMSPDQQAQMRNQLQAEWNSLPADQKQQIEQRLAQRRENHQQRQGGQYGQQQPGYGQQQSGQQQGMQYGPQGGMQYGPQGPASRSNDDGDDE